MADWQRTIHLNPEWDKALNEEISPQEMAGIVAKRLASLSPLTGSVALAIAELVRGQLIEEFEQLAKDEDAGDNEFNELMTQLYDWGDRTLDNHWNGKKVCFIDTISTPR